MRGMRTLCDLSSMNIIIQLFDNVNDMELHFFYMNNTLLRTRLEMYSVYDSILLCLLVQDEFR